jgi:hypothetical protein
LHKLCSSEKKVTSEANSPLTFAMGRAHVVDTSADLIHFLKDFLAKCLRNIDIREENRTSASPITTK